MAGRGGRFAAPPAQVAPPATVNTPPPALPYPAQPTVVAGPRRVFDLFLFGGSDLHLLRLRLRELWDVVDVFVVAEGNATFTGRPARRTLWDSRALPAVEYVAVGPLPPGGLRSARTPRRPWALGPVAFPGSFVRLLPELAQRRARLRYDLCVSYVDFAHDYPELLAPHDGPAGDRCGVLTSWHLGTFVPPEAVVSKVRAFAHSECNFAPVNTTEWQRFAQCECLHFCDESKGGCFDKSRHKPAPKARASHYANKKQRPPEKKKPPGDSRK
eukprot:gene5868-5787_t